MSSIKTFLVERFKAAFGAEPLVIINSLAVLAAAIQQAVTSSLSVGDSAWAAAWVVVVLIARQFVSPASPPS